MANDEHVAMLRKGVAAWNEWRLQNRGIRPDLSGANLDGVPLIGAHLSGVDLTAAHLFEANLAEADLTHAQLFETHLPWATLTAANLSGAGLSSANLSPADLTGANLFKATLSGATFAGGTLAKANLAGADLTGTNLTETSLAGANLTGAFLVRTVFAYTALSEVQGLEHCRHGGPSIVDLQTLKNSGPLPIAFLRGIGLPDRLIEYLPSLLNEAIQHYSCFISYSSKDDGFAKRLHADLQNHGVRCWFAPHDMPIGAKIIDAIDEAIRLRDKVLLILSEGAIASDWVGGEVTRALDEERTRKQVVLFPVRLDDVVMQTSEGWARLLRAQRNIGDFSGWKEHDSYQKSFERLMRDLRVQSQHGSEAPETR
jgi:hypothetical protein